MSLKCSNLYKINWNWIVYINSAFVIYIRQSRKCNFLRFCVFFVPDSSPFPSSIPHAFKINFNSLYMALCEQQTSDQATLLLYTLLHQNSNIRTYMLARTDMENLVSTILSIVFVSYNILKSNFFSQEGMYVVCLPAKVDSQDADREMAPAKAEIWVWQCGRQCTQRWGHRAEQGSTRRSESSRSLTASLLPMTQPDQSCGTCWPPFSRGYLHPLGSFPLLSVHPPCSSHSCCVFLVSMAKRKGDFFQLNSQMSYPFSWLRC